MKIHTVVRNIIARLYECRTCNFVSDDLTEVAQHVVRNQFNA